MLRRAVMMAMLGLAVIGAGGCTAEQKAAHSAAKELTVPEAVAAHKEGAVFLDANTEDIRKNNGKVPGAVLLTNYRTYDVKSLLPENKDTPLVFYCSSKT